MIANTAVFGNHLDRDVSEIFFDKFAGYQSEALQVAHVEPAPAGNHFTEAELSALGPLRAIDEGDSVQFDSPVEGNKVTRYYTEFGLGIQITKHMYKDDLTGNFRKMPSKLSKSANYKIETEFWDLFNSGFGTHTAADGEYIFDEDHTPLKAGDDQANEPAVAGSLSETTLLAGFESFDALKDESGMPLDMTPYLLIVPYQLRTTAGKLLGNEGILGSANNDMNSVNPANGIYPGWGVHISKFLTSATAWFLLAQEHDFRFLWKEEAALESADDFFTSSALFKVTMRFGTFCNQWKGAYGNEGA